MLNEERRILVERYVKALHTLVDTAFNEYRQISDKDISARTVWDLKFEKAIIESQLDLDDIFLLANISLETFRANTSFYQLLEHAEIWVGKIKKD